MSEIGSHYFLGIVDSDLNTENLILNAYASFHLQSCASIFVLVSEKEESG